MRRWNGWGDAAVTEPLRPEALAFLARAVGPAEPPRDATLEQALQHVAAQPSRLPPHPRVDTGAAARLAVSFGQSALDWLRLRFGEIGRVTDGVAYPEHAGEVRELLDWAAAVGACVMPGDGTTSVVGHLTPAGARPGLTLHLGRMGPLLGLDCAALLATFEAGVAGPQVEAQWRAHGLTLGPFRRALNTPRWAAGSPPARRAGNRRATSASSSCGPVPLCCCPVSRSTTDRCTSVPALPPRPGRTYASGCWAPRGAWASSPKRSCASRRCRRWNSSPACSYPRGMRPRPPCASWPRPGWACRCCAWPTPPRRPPRWQWPAIPARSPGWSAIWRCAVLAPASACCSPGSPAARPR